MSARYCSEEPMDDRRWRVRPARDQLRPWHLSPGAATAPQSVVIVRALPPSHPPSTHSASSSTPRLINLSTPHPPLPLSTPSVSFVLLSTHPSPPNLLCSQHSQLLSHPCSPTPSLSPLYFIRNLVLVFVFTPFAIVLLPLQLYPHYYTP